MGISYVIGSINMDMVIQVPRRPDPGETLTGSGFLLTPGGKGANQAVAMAKLGGRVRMLGKTGGDIFGRDILSGMEAYGVDVSGIQSISGLSTGVAVITLCDGENTIILDPGANAQVTPADIQPHAKALCQADTLVMQLEIPLETLEYAYQTVQGSPCKVFINPAPAPLTPLPDELYEGLYALTPNEHEASLITQIPVTDLASAYRALDVLRHKGVLHPVITLGGQGAVYYDGTGNRHQPAIPSQVVDTTAAGDTFTAGLAVITAQGGSMNEAVEFATRAAHLTVSRLGAQRSIPLLEEVQGLSHP